MPSLRDAARTILNFELFVVEVVNSLGYGKNSYAFALNSQGEAIVHPNSTFMSTVEKPAPSLLKIPDRNLNAIAQKISAFC